MTTTTDPQGEERCTCGHRRKYHTGEEPHECCSCECTEFEKDDA